MAKPNLVPPAPPFPIVTANAIASEETQTVPKPPRNTTLEGADLRTPKARELYVVRVVQRVATIPVPGADRNYQIFKKDVPSKATTKHSRCFHRPLPSVFTIHKVDRLKVPVSDHPPDRRVRQSSKLPWRNYRIASSLYLTDQMITFLILGLRIEAVK